MAAPKNIKEYSKGRCGTCAWLGKGIIEGLTSGRPYAAVCDEAEPEYRENPSSGFHFMPVGFNADKIGHLVCFRLAANLPKEAAALGAEPTGGAPSEAVWTDVVWKDRQCRTWSQWVPCISPREQLAEERSRRFTLDLKRIETRLTWTGIGVAIVIGLLQLSLMTPDSLGWKLWTRAANWWHSFGS
jgi:hypothetical protein